MQRDVLSIGDYKKCQSTLGTSELLYILSQIFNQQLILYVNICTNQLITFRFSSFLVNNKLYVYQIIVFKLFYLLASI